MSAEFSCPLGCAGEAGEEGRMGSYRLFSCPSCGLRFAPEAFDAPVNYDEIYDTREYWDGQIKPLQDGEDPGKLMAHPTYAPFFAQVKAGPGARLLDVGCGVGRFGGAAQARGFSFSGIDVSAKAVEIGRKYAGLPLRASRLDDEAAGPDRYEVVTAFEVLEHVGDPIHVLATMQGLLRPGGELFVTVPNWDCSLVQEATRPDWLPPVHVQYFTAGSLWRAGERSGLCRQETGVIWGDAWPRGALARARWLTRRFRFLPNEPLGLWLHGYKV